MTNHAEINKKKIPCEVWTRSVGYYRPVYDFNIGKQQEFRDRKTYNINKAILKIEFAPNKY